MSDERNEPTDSAASTLLPDEDIVAAMRAMSGYLDITLDDFREIYQRAHDHALERLFGRLDVRHLMRRDLSALRPDQTLSEAAEHMAHMHAHLLPVLDDDGHVIGDVSEWNFLRGFGADTFFYLVFRLQAHDQRFLDYCNETRVADVMTNPAVTLSIDDDFAAMVRVFHDTEGQRLPVVDADGRLQGVVLRRDFLRRFHPEDWL